VGIKNRERRKAKQNARRASAAGGGERFGFHVPLQPPRPWADLARQELRLAIGYAGRGDEPAVADSCEHLATRLGDAAARAEIDHELFAIVTQTVTDAWGRGWQPAELHRVVTKLTGAAPATVLRDAMAAAMRPHASATVDERWEAQLNALGVGVWWPADDTYVDEYARLAGAARADVYRTAVYLLGCLGHLPVIATLMPPPGKGRRGALASGSRPELDQRMLERVRGLLAKAESTNFEAEAETYTAKAQELMARHSIDYAVLSAQTGGTDQPACRRVGIDAPYEAEKNALLSAVAHANRAQAVWSQQLGFSTLVGFPGDLDAIEVLFTSLLVQATRAMTQAGQRRDAHGRSRTRSFRQAFLSGFAHRIGDRLRQATEHATAEAVSEASAAGRASLLPVLASRDEQVTEAVHAAFPHLVHKTGPRISNAEGWHSGVAAADRASLKVHEELPR
jgi:hypothetical protein